MAIKEAKDLNKISLDEICGSFIIYKQEVNQMEEKENKEVDKKKSLALKMSSHKKETSESSCEDEEYEMAIVAKRYKKLGFQKSQRMERGTKFNKNRFNG